MKSQQADPVWVTGIAHRVNPSAGCRCQRHRAPEFSGRLRGSTGQDGAVLRLRGSTSAMPLSVVEESAMIGHLQEFASMGSSDATTQY